MKQPLRLIDMIALKTLVAGVALVQGPSTAGAQSEADGEGAHSSQFRYFIQDTEIGSPERLAQAIYRLACRTNFAAPGYALIRQTRISSSTAHRESLVELKQNLSHVHTAVTGSRLGWFSINRFDQKNTSKPHRDGGPPQSLLLVGYEPSKVASDLFIADYSACAYQLGLSPVQFLEEFNPMYKKVMANLAPYIMPLTEFDSSFYNILIINNSCQALNRMERHWQGVLHYANVYGLSGAPRMINSLSIKPLIAGEDEGVPDQAVKQFLSGEKPDQVSTASTGDT